MRPYKFYPTAVGQWFALRHMRTSPPDPSRGSVGLAGRSQASSFSPRPRTGEGSGVRVSSSPRPRTGEGSGVRVARPG